MTDWRAEFIESFPDLDCKRDWSLKQQTYFKVGGMAELFLQISELATLQKVVHYCYSHQVRLTLLGGASNVIVSDQGITGVVIQLTATHCEVLENTVQAGAGLKTALLVSKTVAAGLTGLEYFLGVPGTVGGAVLNNAHYLSHLISQYVVRVQVVTETGEVLWLSKQDCDFGYDHSRFQTSREIIWQVEFQLPAGDAETSKALIREATEYRAKTQPLGWPSSGCIFQNVPNTSELQVLFPQFREHEFVPGGFLIDQAGLKGLRVGDIEVSDKHAAFMINHGQGTSLELQELIKQVKTAVKAKFGVELQEEVFYLS
jgi:UDP-N-acetylmuramate dehydrogenase